MTPKQKKDWATFLRGRWTRQMPQKEGIYPVQGIGECLPLEPSTTRGVFRDPTTKELRIVNGTDCYSSWGGWWWTVPFPTLQSPPHEKD